VTTRYVVGPAIPRALPIDRPRNLGRNGCARLGRRLDLGSLGHDPVQGLDLIRGQDRVRTGRLGLGHGPAQLGQAGPVQVDVQALGPEPVSLIPRITSDAIGTTRPFWSTRG
jgi:hypothetical protein